MLAPKPAIRKGEAEEGLAINTRPEEAPMDISRVQFQSLRPMLRTKDLQATIEFYTWRLGFTCDGMSEADGWASLRRDAVSLMVATPNAHTPFDAPAFTGSLYFNVDARVRDLRQQRIHIAVRFARSGVTSR